VAALAALALGLGYAGFEQLPEGRDYAWTDSLHRAIQLFVLESGGVEPPTPWPLELARALAPLVTVYAAAVALVALFRDELRLLGLRLWGRDHVVIAGLGAKGLTLARAFHSAGGRVVAVERDGQGAAARRCRERGIPVVEGDAAEEHVLLRARVDRARQLVVTCGDDGANASVALTARRLSRRAPGAVTVLVHLDDLDLWRLLGADELGRGDRSTVRLEFFNVQDGAARAMLDEHPPFRNAETAPHLLIVGLDGLGERLLLHAAARWRERPAAGERRLRVTVVAPDAARRLDLLARRHPGLGELCALEPRDLEVAGELASSAWPSADAEPAVAYVTLAREAEALAAALALRAAPGLRPGLIVVAVEDERTVAPSGGPTPVRPFGVLSRTLTPELVRRGTGEALARAKHEQYVRAERANGVDPATNPSMRPWEELDERLKESNRRFADGVAPKLEAAGLVLVPDPLADPARAPTLLSEDEVEELAREEHERWCRDLRREGWHPTDGPKDTAARRHPQLVPWERLSEEAREKDRGPVRELPAMLARVGFEMHRAHPAAGDGDGDGRGPLLRSSQWPASS
jgi:voltage-gated potassium channel Kch